MNLVGTRSPLDEMALSGHPAFGKEAAPAVGCLPATGQLVKTAKQRTVQCSVSSLQGPSIVIQS